MKTGPATIDTSSPTLNLFDRAASPAFADVDAPCRDHAGRIYSRLQQDIFADVERGTGHTVVLAYAGSGKSTTILESLRRVPAGLTIVVVAFNKEIERALSKRAPKGVEVKTIHKHGFSAVRRAFSGVRIDEFKTANIVESMFGTASAPEDEVLEGESEAIVKLVGIAKDTLVGADAAIALVRRAGTSVDENGRRVATLVRSDAADGLRADHPAVERLDELVDRFGVDLPETDEDREPREADVRLAICRKALVVLARSMQVTSVIDFSDMCWLPVVLNLRIWAFDRVFVDETQDLSPCQIELVKRFVKRGGRICAVGDENQAIYTWRGADEDAIPGLIRALRARTLPLSITYRCPLSVVRLAQRVVPDFQAAPDAPEGLVDRTGTKDRLLAEAKPGDMVVSCTNAPLIGLCLGLLVRGRRATIMGRNIGEGLFRLIEKSRAKDVEGLEIWIEGWCVKETARLLKKKRDAQEIEDKKACILALCRDAESVAEVRERAEDLFSDKNDEPKVLLGTTHKAKGLEADKVWMLESTYRPKRGGEEARLWYVAVTRAKQTLVLTMLPKEDENSKEVAA